MSKTTGRTVGMLVRERREGMRLTMEDLAARSQVSRSTLNRIEHDHKTRATAAKLAQVLVVLGVTAEEATAALDDERYLGDVLHWMGRPAAFVDVANGLRPREHLAAIAGAAPDMVAMKDGHHVSFTSAGSGGLEEVRDVLRASGWRVLRDA